MFCSFESSDVPSVSSSSLDTRHTTEHETLIIGKEDVTTQNTGKCLIQRLKSYCFDEIWNVHKITLNNLETLCGCLWNYKSGWSRD